MRKASLVDVPLLVRMMNEFYSDSPYTLNPRRATDAFTALLNDQRLGSIWVIQSNSQDVGYVVLTLCHSMTFGGLIAVVDDFFIQPRFRGVGLGKAAMGDYRLIREIGRGGMGVVFEAVQESLHRHVALKVLPYHSWVKPKHLQRFEREAHAAARLHHTNIVPVFGVGEHEGIHYYAMQFIHGQSLDAVLAEVQRLRGQKAITQRVDSTSGKALAFNLAESLAAGQFSLADGRGSGARSQESGVAGQKSEIRGQRSELGGQTSEVDSETPAASRLTPDSCLPAPSSGSQSDLRRQTEFKYFRSVAEIGVQVADALAYAHGQGVLHRDIKPSNLMLDMQGRVWITDFGLAKTAQWVNGGDLAQQETHSTTPASEHTCDPSLAQSIKCTRRLISHNRRRFPISKLLQSSPDFGTIQKLQYFNSSNHPEPSRRLFKYFFQNGLQT
jgi:hypothetical protein